MSSTKLATPYMNLSEKLQAWWDDLDSPQRAVVLSGAGEIPEWVANNLQEVGIVVVRAEFSDVGPPRVGYLLPAAVADFVDTKREDRAER